MRHHNRRTNPSLNPRRAILMAWQERRQGHLEQLMDWEAIDAMTIRIDTLKRNELLGTLYALMFDAVNYDMDTASGIAFHLQIAIIKAHLVNNYTPEFICARIHQIARKTHYKVPALLMRT